MKKGFLQKDLELLINSIEFKDLKITPRQRNIFILRN